MQPEQITKVCCFLASDLSSYLIDATIDVNGGRSIRAPLNSSGE